MASSTLLVDGHVHFYDCYRQAAFFAGALENFAAAAKRLKLSHGFQGCLLMTETAQDHRFSAWRREAEDQRANGQRAGDDGAFQKTAEDCSLTFVAPGGASLAIVAGRQIVTAERLEVLALGHDGEFADGLDLDDTLAAVARSGALAAIPWAFGKWWSERGRLVAAKVAGTPASELYLGDNGGRPSCSGTPAIFKAAQKRGYVILPGSDPLPFASETARAGGYGFMLEGEWDENRPFASIKAALARRGPQLKTFGTRVGPLKFMIDQVRMRL